MKAVFLDRDGTICAGEPKYSRVDSLEKVELLPNTTKALEILKDLDYEVFIVTNQAGIAEGLISLDEFAVINKRVLELIAPTGINILKTYVCPHGVNDNCECRKPKPKLILDAAQEFNINLKDSWMIGDRPTDVMAGINAGTKTILVKTGVLNAESDQATYTAPSLLEAVQFIASSER